jgi:hypothetical protein
MRSGKTARGKGRSVPARGWKVVVTYPGNNQTRLVDRTQDSPFHQFQVSALLVDDSCFC